MGNSNEEIEGLERKRTGLLESYAKDVARLSLQLKRDLATVDEQVALRMSFAGELEVLKRHTPGPRVTIYHSALRPCGRVTGPGHSRSSFTTVLEAEVKRQGLKRCSACGWREHELEAAMRRRG